MYTLDFTYFFIIGKSNDRTFKAISIKCHFVYNSYNFLKLLYKLQNVEFRNLKLLLIINKFYVYHYYAKKGDGFLDKYFYFIGKSKLWN